MIHHFLFADTFFVDSVAPFYLLIDSLFNIGFYQPYSNESSSLGGLIFKSYGYIFSIVFLVKAFSLLNWRLSKSSLIENLAYSLIIIMGVELFLIYICGAIALSDVIKIFFQVENPLVEWTLIIFSMLLISPVLALAVVMLFSLFKKFMSWKNI
jgi:hypothetical protein